MKARPVKAVAVWCVASKPRKMAAPMIAHAIQSLGKSILFTVERDYHRVGTASTIFMSAKKVRLENEKNAKNEQG